MKPLIMLAFALTLAAQVGEVPQNALPTGSSSVEGTVINQVTQAPVRQAEVTISANAPPAVTDATGRFAFRNLAPGTYWIQANHPHFPRMLRAQEVQPLSVTLTQDEQKRDLIIALIPGASISGTILDEAKKPLRGCMVSALGFFAFQPERNLSSLSNANSDSRGQYRIEGLSAGRYYLMARCEETLPAPHALMRIGPDTDLPQLRYPPEFYPGYPDPTGSGRLVVAAGADLQGVDFQLHPTATVTVRGRFTGDLEALKYNPWVQLLPRDPLLSTVFQYGGPMDARRNTFQINAVPPGLYTLEAVANNNERAYQAQMPIDIGPEPPEPIEIAFSSGASFSGSIEMAGDQPQSLQNVMIRLTPLAWPAYSQPSAKLENGGKFALAGVMPGRWRLDVQGVHAYVKSLTVGDQAVSPYGFDVAAGSGGVMRIVMDAQFAQVEGTLSDSTPDGEGNVFVTAVPEDPDRLGTGGAQSSGVGANGHFFIGGLVPGRYRLYGLAGVQPWAILEDAAVLQSISARGTQVELGEGGKATAQVDIIPAEELMRVIRGQE